MTADETQPGAAAFEFYREHDGSLPLESAVFQALGAASVCWESMTGTGIFDDVRARAIGEALLARIRVDGGQDAVADLVEAIRLTVEYVGLEQLPPVDGWSWYDALRKHAPELADHFVAEAERLGGAS